ncbi:hypothetical protein D3C72_731850 [compost metagenome]
MADRKPWAGGDAPSPEDSVLRRPWRDSGGEELEGRLPVLPEEFGIFDLDLPTFESLDPKAHALPPRLQKLAEQVYYLNTAARLYPDLLGKLNTVLIDNPEIFPCLEDDEQNDALYVQHLRTILRTQKENQGDSLIWFASCEPLVTWARDWRIKTDSWIFAMAAQTIGYWQSDPNADRTTWAFNNVARGPSLPESARIIEVTNFDWFLETPEAATDRLEKEIQRLRELKASIKQAKAEASGSAPRALHHFEWTAHRHFGRKTYAKIADLSGTNTKESVTEPAIKKAITNLKRRISLEWDT